MVLASKIPYFPLNSLNREIKAGFKPKSRVQTRSCSLLALLTFALIRDVMTTEWRLLFPWKPTHQHRTIEIARTTYVPHSKPKLEFRDVQDILKQVFAFLH